MTDQDRINHLDEQARFLLAEKNKWFAQAKSLERRLAESLAALSKAEALLVDLYRVYHDLGGEGVPFQDRLNQVVAPRRVSGTLPFVLQFALRMEAKLEANRHKGDREGWIRDDPQALFERLKQEAAELEREILVGFVRMHEPANAPFHADKLANEAADVANFALMIADWHLARAGGAA